MSNAIDSYIIYRPSYLAKIEETEEKLYSFVFSSLSSNKFFFFWEVIYMIYLHCGFKKVVFVSFFNPKSSVKLEEYTT